MLVPDFETKILLDIHDRLIPNPDEWKKLEKYIRERTEMVRRGVVRTPTWFQEELNRLDSRLRCWWDAWTERWVIDRLQDEGIVERLTRAARETHDHDGAIALEQTATGLLAKGAYYLTVMQFQPTPLMQLDRQCLAFLKKCDMQRFESPEAYMAEKREQAEKTRLANEQASTEKVMAAVDKLSSKQLEQFIAVETAIQTGETITAHGADAKFLEQAAQEKSVALKNAEARGQRLILDNPHAAINPGMDPRVYKRRRPKSKGAIYSK